MKFDGTGEAHFLGAISLDPFRGENASHASTKKNL